MAFSHRWENAAKKQKMQSSRAGAAAFPDQTIRVNASRIKATLSLLRCAGPPVAGSFVYGNNQMITSHCSIDSDSYTTDSQRWRANATRSYGWRFFFCHGTSRAIAVQLPGQPVVSRIHHVSSPPPVHACFAFLSCIMFSTLSPAGRRFS